MQFWLVVVGAFLAILGVLGVVVDTDLSPYFEWTTDNFWRIFVWALPILPILGFVLLSFFRFSLSSLAKNSIGFLLIIGFWGAFAVRTLFFVSDFERQIPNVLNDSMSQKVIATVQIGEISDSIYDASMGQTYRHRAVITNIRPTSENQIGHLPTIANPFYTDKYQNSQLEWIHANKQEIADKLTVMLVATPPKNLPKSTNDKHGDDFTKWHQLNDLKAGEQVQMTLLLSKIRQDDTQLFDFYKYAKTRHIHANARILAVDWQSVQPIQNATIQKPLMVLENWRWAYRQVFLSNFYHQPMSHEQKQGLAVVLSLLTGDRALIDGDTKALYQLAGISHLLAISGTHILFLAVVMSSFLNVVIGRYFTNVYRIVTRPTLHFLILASVATVYALFTGFDVPAVRTVLMLVAVGVVRRLMLDWSAWKILTIVGLILAFFDPFVLWQAGFWLSFVAVGLLMHYDNNFYKNEGLDLLNNTKNRFIALVKLQTYLFFAMLPISLLLFGQVSWFGLVVNLFAVGLFGTIVVPFNLMAGVLYPILPIVSLWIWGGLGALMGGLAGGFGALGQAVANPYLAIPISVGMMLLLFLAVWVAKSALPSRFAIVPVLSVVFLARPEVPNQTLIYPLNIEGLSVNVVQTQEQSWLIIEEQTKRLKSYEFYKETIKANLVKLGINQLNGAIIQTNNDILAKAVGQLSLEMTVGELWWAGGRQRFGKLHAQPCLANQVMGAHFVAMTGWREIANDNMHACAIWLNNEQALTVVGDAKSDYPTTNVVFDVGSDDRLWQVWHLMCANENRPIQPLLLNEKRGSTTKKFLGLK